MATGRVTSFDPDLGWGELTADPTAGGESYGFHLTAVADGSRHIEVGTTVSFDVVAGHQGRWEARNLTPLL
jgi:cold shock CspA family protein